MGRKTAPLYRVKMAVAGVGILVLLRLACEKENSQFVDICRTKHGNHGILSLTKTAVSGYDEKKLHE
jgi:hypothetical protein